MGNYFELTDLELEQLICERLELFGVLVNPNNSSYVTELGKSFALLQYFKGNPKVVLEFNTTHWITVQWGEHEAYGLEVSVLSANTIARVIAYAFLTMTESKS